MRTLAIVIVLLAAGVTSTPAQPEPASEGAWSLDGFIVDGPFIPRRVYAMTVYRGDLVVGGSFSAIGGIDLNNIGIWNGREWSPLEDGIEGTVYALAVYDGDLYAAGRFFASGEKRIELLARWDGQTWHQLGDGVGGYSIDALAVYDGELVAGGPFWRAGGNSVRRIARWNGESWTSLGDGLWGDYSGVNAFASYNGDLIVGGAFPAAGLASSRNIARWDGTNWIRMGSGLDSFTIFARVRALEVFEGRLIVGGEFHDADGVAVGNIAAWDGERWHPFGDFDGVLGMYENRPYVQALETYQGRLVAGGSFTEVDGAAVNGVACWDGSRWLPLTSGTDGAVLAAAVFRGDLLVGGEFTTAGGVNSNALARWTGLLPPGSPVSETITLLPNHPNPFHSETTIRFSITTRAAVRVSVLDVTGRLVRVLVDGTLDPGLYATAWRVPDASGVYLLRLDAGTTGLTRKLIAVH